MGVQVTWMSSVGEAAHSRTCAPFCGYIKLVHYGLSEKERIPSCTQLSQQQTASWHWLDGEGSHRKHVF